jgi:DNA-binding transcriptional ArsR family regulator
LIGKWLLAYRVVVADDVFKALADPTRRRILDELSERDGQSLFELCGRLLSKHGLGLSRQAISQHLAVLESAGLVRTRRQGRYKFHDLDTEPLERIVTRWLKPDTPESTP